MSVQIGLPPPRGPKSIPQHTWAAPMVIRSVPQTQESMLSVSHAVSHPPQCESSFATQWESQQS